MSEPEALLPVEHLPIPLFDGVVLAVRSKEGQIYLSLRDLCLVLGLDLAAQRRRIRTSTTMTLAQFRMLVERQVRTIDFLLLDSVPVWIMSVQLGKVNDQQRERFGYIQSYLIGAVQHAFAQLTGLPNTPSQQIEDIGTLDQMELAFQQLAALTTRQTALEDSQDRARRVYRDVMSVLDELRERVQQLEIGTKNRLSEQQRGTIYHMVEAWGEAVAARNPKQKAGVAIRNCWRLLHQRYNVSTYTDLPASKYDEIIQFIKQQYHAVTGAELPATEQQDLGL